jgi:hypothetical protein
MSQLITVSTTLTANQLTGNILAGNINEFLARPALVSVFMSASGSSPQVSMTAGGVSVAQGNICPNTNRFPVRPDDGIVQFQAPAGARLFMQLRETAGATPTVITVIDIDYLA